MDRCSLAWALDHLIRLLSRVPVKLVESQGMWMLELRALVGFSTQNPWLSARNWNSHYAADGFPVVLVCSFYLLVMNEVFLLCRKEADQPGQEAMLCQHLLLVRHTAPGWKPW